jgi:hypothetical protein
MDAQRARRGVVVSWILGSAIVLACLANGCVPFLTRIGVLEPAAFAEYVRTYCKLSGPIRFPTATCGCMQDPGWPATHDLPSSDHVFRSDGVRLLPKLGKDLLAGGIVLAGIAAWLRSRRGSLSLAAPAPRALAVLVAMLAVGVVQSAIADGLAPALLGLRSFGFLALAMFAGWTVASLPVLARCLVGLLLLECLLASFEFAYALPTRACPRFFRAAGTMVSPSALGIVSAGCAAFVVALGVRGVVLALALAAAVALALAAGSGTGLVLLGLLAAWFGWLALPRRRRIPGASVGVAGFLVLLFALPALTHRPDVWDSVQAQGGRVDTLASVLRENTVGESLIGQGLALGTNQATNLSAMGLRTARTPLESGEPFHADSTITALLVQVGLVGVLAFYAMLAWAFRIDSAMRPFYLVAAVASLTISLPETFPLNLLLGLALARSAQVARTRALHGPELTE